MNKLKGVLADLDNFLKPPTKEEMEETEKKHKERARSDPNNLSFWFPKIKDVVPVPKTEIIETDIEIYKLLDRKIPNGFPEFLKQLEQAGNNVGYPCFLRTGHTSGKHDWNGTCYVLNEKDFPNHVTAIVEYSEICAMRGELPCYTWAVRELLPTKPIFYAFNGMPVVREFRYFADSIGVSHRQPYWPPDTIKEFPGYPLPKDWKEKLNNISFVTKEENELLTKLSIKIGSAIDKRWAIDWLETENGWDMTDMAIEERAFKWKPPQNIVK